MQEALERQQGETLHQDSWQSYEITSHTSSRPQSESSYRRNIRRRNNATKAAWGRAYAKDERDSSGHLKRPRISNCGRTGFGRGSVEIVTGEVHAHAKGQAYCENAKECPVCSEIIRRSRESEINQGVKAHLKAGGSILLATFTIQHHQGERLRDLQSLLYESFSSMTGKRRFRDLMREFGVLGRVRCYEVMYGKNGWHPHFHAVVFLESHLSEEQASFFISEWKHIWIDTVEGHGGYATYENGLDVQIARDAEAVGSYIAKELTNASDAKDGRGSLSPFQLLDDMTPENERLWNEYVAATKGKHLIGWSKGMRDLLGLQHEKSDSEIIKEADEQGGESLGYVGMDVWNEIQNNGTLQEQALGAIAARDYDHAAMILGCSYYMITVPVCEGSEIYNHIPMFYLDNEQRRTNKNAYD